MSDIEQPARFAARSLLAYAGARVADGADTGLFTALPVEVAALAGNLLSGTSLLQALAPADHRACLEAWERARATGRAHVDVRLPSPSPSSPSH